MAQRKEEAWLTSVTNDASVANAMVLAESIRRTRTTRTIAVITSRNVSVEKRVALRKGFNAVFCMDEACDTAVDFSDNGEDVKAKMYAFSLSFFKKCIYLSSNSLVLENADDLFDINTQFESLQRRDGDCIDLSFFLFTPNEQLWNCLCNSGNQNGKMNSDSFLSTWLENQMGTMKIRKSLARTVVRFSLLEGKLLTDKTHARIIQLIHVKSGASILKQMESLKTSEIGLREKLIMTSWLQILHESVLPILNKSNTHSIYDGNKTLQTDYVNEPIAIIGMSCRYPGANSVEEFWNMLYEGEEGIREPPAFRWTKEHAVRVTQQERKTNAGFLKTKVDEFDAKFFGVSPKEATYMDPQTRLLHEVLWESLENAGIDPLSLYGSHTGIFTGSWMNDYKDIVQCSTDKDFFRTYMGNSIGAAAARLSFLLGLTGPSVATESGCSSAIVALDLAVKSLRNGETSLAVAGGVNLLLYPFTSNIMDYVIAPNGRCKTFDSKADGFGRAEGCGILVLKRLSDALRDRDNIWAMIRGSAVSQEGLSRSLGTPTVHCEALAMQLALQDANVKPEEVSFVETHGTGTSVGDPMEVAAINKAYRTPMRKSPLVIGSVKTNVGHTESCSGITGVMKAVLAMQHELIPKHRNLETLNPEIFLDSIPATIPLEPVAWPKVKGHPRLAGVSSFGITGTDGHVIIEEAPDYELPKFNLGLERPTHIFKISGKSSEALEQLLGVYENIFFERAGSREYADKKAFANAAYSANVGRASYNHRAFIVASDYGDAVKTLRTKKYFQGEIKDGENGKTCFLFTGQGSQYPGMAKALYDTSPIFRINFDACDRTLKEMYNLSIREVLWESDPSSKELSKTIYSQTSIFCVEYCLLKLWESWGIQPDFVLGHSLGEFCAAVAAGILDFEDALKLVTERSRLISNLCPGSMLVIQASKPKVEELLQSAKMNLDIAAVNTNEQTVVAGDTGLVHQFMAYLKNQGVKVIILEATHAFHSKHMDPILEKYRQIAETIEYKHGNGRTQYLSGMEGRLIGDFSELTVDYWVRHTRENVNFMDACVALRDTECQDFLEIGPQPILSSFVMMNNEGSPLNCFPSLRRGMDDWQTILTSLGKLYLLGYKVDWKEYDEPYLRNKVSLPFHPQFKKSFWVESTGGNSNMIHPLLGSNFSNASTLNIFQNDLSPKSVLYVKDHCIGERIVFPGACFTEMCLSAGYCVANGLRGAMEPPRRAMRLENVRIETPLELKAEKTCRLQVIVDLPESQQLDKGCDVDHQGFRVKIYHQDSMSEESGKWILHASSIFIPVASTKDSLKQWNPNRIAEIVSTQEALTPEKFYKRVDDAGLRFGESFRMIQRYWSISKPDPSVDVDEVVSEILVPTDGNKYSLHPLIIDAALQSGILTTHAYKETKLRVPVRLGSVTMFSGIGEAHSNGSLYLHAWLENGSYNTFICTSDYTPIALIEDIELLETNVKTIESILEQQSSHIPEAWEEKWKVIPSPFNSFINAANVKEVFKNPTVQQKLNAMRNTSTETVNLYHKSNRLLYLYILNAFYELGWNPKKGELIQVESFCSGLDIKPGFQKLVRFYFTVLQEESELLVCENEHRSSWKVKLVPPGHAQVKLELTELRLALERTNFATTVAINENLAVNLAKIMTGRESALNLLFPADENKHQFSADHYYQTYPGRNDATTVFSIVCNAILNESQTHNADDPGRVFRFLEVGAGTGSLSLEMLKGIKKICGDRYEFYFTDISQSFFTKAESKLAEYGKNIKYAIFDIEKSPLSQGIPLNYFDMVTATDTLHATRNLQETLVHLRQTLRPGGTICFTETVTESRNITFVFGVLEGYWRYEDLDWRPHHCCVGVKGWTQLLNRCGFQVVNTAKAFCDEFACISAVATSGVALDTLIVANAAETNRRQADKRTWIIFAEEQSFQMTSEIAKVFVLNGNKVVIVLKSGMHANIDNANGNIQYILGDPAKLSEMEAIIGGDMERQVQGVIYAWGMDINEQDQSKVALPLMYIAKALLVLHKPPQFFVLTQGVHAVPEDAVTYHPTAATLLGMLKSLKNENSDLLVRCIDLEHGSSVTDQVNQVIFELAMIKGMGEQRRVQVAYRGRSRHEPRLVKATLPKPDDELKLPPSTDRYQLVLPDSRLIQDLKFDSLDGEQVEDGEVEIKVMAYSLNFKDILTILKPSVEFERLNTIGLDFAGIVTKTGSSSKLSIGERVFGANFKEAQLPSHLVLAAESVLRIPKRMTYWEAATLPAVFSTAYYCLITVAKMKKGDTVLIHTGSGGVGLAAIQLAKQVGANIITTAGNERKRSFLRSLGIQHVFHSRNTSFEEGILRVTNGKGVDVVLNSITGSGIKEATLNASAKNARFVEMSKLSIWSPEEVKALRPDVHYSIVDLTVLKAEEWAQLLQNMEGFLSNGLLSAIPYVKFDALNIRQALQYFQKAKHIGKVVCTMPEVIKEGGVFKVKVAQFNSESTYLITGGLGGIGFEVCKWMLGLGATDVVLMGRSPPKPEVTAQIKELNASGANVTLKLGDVGNYSNCQSVIDAINLGSKPLRGVMHCAGVLRDSLYPNQTWETFQATFIPKVTGTWNLHNLTTDLPLEHFIMFSSMTALIGTPGQPNHAAANCFEDAFIHYRHSLGLPGTTINWGQWSQVGVAKEIHVLGILPVSVNRMLNGMELVLRAQKRQVCFCDFESISNFSMMCPLIKSYFDERLWKQLSSASQKEQAFKGDQFWKDMDEKETKTEKIAVFSIYLKAILRIALRLESDDPISDNANIQELGVDSLMMIELKNSIQTLLGTRISVTANLIKNCNTVRTISTAIVGKLMEEDDEDDDEILTEPLSPPELLELLSKDCVLDEMISATSLPPPSEPSKIRTVLLTGATGQLAPYLLAQITKSYSFVEKIICLMRGPTDNIPDLTQIMTNTLNSMGLSKEVNMKKLEFVSGDITKMCLGIPEQKYNELCKTVDAVIHGAGKVHHSEHYRASENGKLTDTRSVNVGGTLNILTFAATSKTKHVYFPSTFVCGLFQENEEGSLSDDWPKEDVFQTIVDNKLPAHLTSKLICELLLKQANDRGIPCKVFRFPWIAGESRTGRLNYLNNLYIHRFLSFLKLGAIPSLATPANFLPVDKCSELSLQLFFNEKVPNEVFNIGHPHPQVEQEFVQVARQDFGKELEILEWNEFTQSLEDNGMQVKGEHKELYKDQKMLGSYILDAVTFTKGYAISPDTFFLNRKVLKFIPDYGQGIPPSMEILRRDLSFLKSIGFLEKFGIVTT